MPTGALVEDLIFDVGMHRGQDAAYYLALGYRVVGFEANPDLVRACEARFAPAIEDGRLTIVEGAIVDSAGPETTFYRPVRPGRVDISAMGSTDPDWLRTMTGRGEVEPIAVPVVDFAACVERFGVPWYLKVDIEGADRLCLEALLAFDARPRWLSLEAERRSIALLRSELDLLERLGYDRFMAVPQGRTGREVATRTLVGQPLRYNFEADETGPFGEDLGGRWRSRGAVQRRYRRTFLHQQMLRRLRGARWGRRLSRRFWRRLPGLFVGNYYDTHVGRSHDG